MTNLRERRLGFALATAVLSCPLLVGCGGSGDGDDGDQSNASSPPVAERTAEPCELLTDGEVAARMSEQADSDIKVTHAPNGKDTCVWEGLGTVSVEVTTQDATANEEFMDNNIAGSDGVEEVDLADVSEGVRAYYEPGNAKGWVWAGGKNLVELQGLYVEQASDDELNVELVKAIASRLAR